MASLARSKESYYVMAAVALVAGLWFVADRAMFLSGAERTQAQVYGVMAVPGDCGRGNHECTKFVIEVRWSSNGEDCEAGIEVGQARGVDAPMPADFDYAIGDTVPLLYDPDDPSEHYLADRNDLWRTPLILLGVAAFLGLVGLAGHIKLF